MIDIYDELYHRLGGQDFRKLFPLYAASLGEEDKKILICAGTGCISSGSLEIYDELKLSLIHI